MEKIGEAHRFPATQQPQGHRIVVFAALGMEEDPMAVKVHDMERIEAAIVLDIPGAQKIGLMDIVDSQGFSEIRVFNSFGGIRSFF